MLAGEGKITRGRHGWSTRAEWDSARDALMGIRTDLSSPQQLAEPSPDAAGVSFVITPITQSVSEGGDLKFKIGVVNPNYAAVGSYKIYWRTNATADHAASSSDYGAITSLQALTFSSSSAQSYTITIHTNTDSITEGTEYFEVDLYDFQGSYLSGSTTVFSILDVPPPKPDLAIGSLTATGSGSTGVSVSGWIFNNGNATAGSSTAKIYLSHDGTLDSGDVVLDTLFVSSLVANGRFDFGKSYVLPSGWSAGTSYIIVDADTGHVVTESDENNNSFKDSFTVTSPTLPDLAIGSLTATGSGSTGVSVSGWIFNNGNATAGASTAKLYLSHDGTIDASDQLLETFSLSSFAPGDRYDFGKSYALPSGWTGTSYIIVDTDTGHVVTESDENNNSFQASFTVASPDIAIGNLTATGSGSGVSVSGWIFNNGNATADASTAKIYLSHDGTIDSDDKVLDTLSVSSLTAGSRYDFGKSYALPSGWTGTSYIIVDADTGHVVTESDESNNSLSAAFAVTQVLDVNPLLEMARLAIESYGPQPFSHSAEALYGTPDARPELTTGITEAAQARGWHALSPEELGLPMFGSAPAGAHYAFAGGHYQAQTPVPLFPDDSQADAIVLSAIIDGKKTLAIAFRGTDQIIDITDYADFDDHYSKFAPLINAINKYITANDIEQVLVSGHSLGGSMAQEFIDTHQPSDYRHTIFRGLTIGSPGTDYPTGEATDPRIINFGHIDDPIFALAPSVTEPASRGLLAAAFPEFSGLIWSIQNKDRHGSDIYLNSDAPIGLTIIGQHDKGLYLKDFLKLLDFSLDPNSPFYETPLAGDMRAGRVYSGPAISIALGDTNSNGQQFALDWRDDWALGSPGNDQFFWSPDILAHSHVHVVDGAYGQDSVTLPGSLTSWTWRPVDDHYELSHVGEVVGELYRVEKLVIGSNVFYLDGHSPTVQHPPTGATLVTVDPNADYLDAGNGNFTILGTAGVDIILLGGGVQTVFAGVGNDIISASPRSAASADGVGDLLVVAGQGGDDFISGEHAGDQGFVVSFSGNRAEYSIKTDGNNLIVADLRDGSPDGTDTLNQVGLLRFQDGEFTIEQILSNIVLGTVGNDILVGGNSNEVMAGNEGNDFLFGMGGDDTLVGGVGEDHLDGGAGNDVLVMTGNALRPAAPQSRTLQPGPEGQDKWVTDVYYNGGVDNDQLRVGGWGDHYNVLIRFDLNGHSLPSHITSAILRLYNTGNNGGSPTALLVDELHTAWDESFRWFDHTLAYTNLSQVTAPGLGWVEIDVTQAVNDWLANPSSNFGLQLRPVSINNNFDFFVSSDATGDLAEDRPQLVLNWEVTGSADSGHDTAIGGEGNDSYYLDDPAAVILEQVGQGYDQVFTTVSYALAQGVEIELLAATYPEDAQALELTGNEFDNEIQGNAGDNILTGGGGADILEGNGGNDRYVYLQPSDSTGAAFDQIVTFDWKNDRIDLPFKVVGISRVGGGWLDQSDVDAGLASAMTDVLNAHYAALFTPDEGDMAGRTFVVIDANGIDGYQAGEDYVIELVAPAQPVPPNHEMFI